MFRSPSVDAIVVLIIVLLILGPKRLPGIGRGIGQGMREFKEGITGGSKDDEDKPSLSEAPPSSTADTGERERSHASAPGSGSSGSDRSA